MKMPVKRKRKSRRELKKWILAGLFVLAIGTGSYLVFSWWMERRAAFVLYPGFGIELPNGYEIHGIDVSHHQDMIKWESVSEMEEKSVKLGFAFIKATEGYSRVDRQFKRNWRKAKETGIPRGAYHFFLPNKNGMIQAENFIRTVELEKGDLPPVLDVEETYGTANKDVRRRVKEWLTVVERHYGVRPILYTSADFYTNILGKEFDDYPLWVAHYLNPVRPRINRDWTFWQHSESGRVNGIFTRVDFNVFNGDSGDFRRLVID
jgi:lysozyme